MIIPLNRKIIFLVHIATLFSFCWIGLLKQGTEDVVMVPIAFTSDHIETLHEIDIQYKEVAEKAGIKHFARAPSLNDEPLLFQAQAELVTQHIARNEAHSSSQFPRNCLECVEPRCRTITNPVVPYQSTRQQAQTNKTAVSSK